MLLKFNFFKKNNLKQSFLGGERDKAKQVLNKLVNEDEAKQMFESLIKEAALSQVGFLCAFRLSMF